MPMRDRLARLVQRNSERPTLRQRAAALKASASKVMQRKPAPAGAIAAAAEPSRRTSDPIFAAIEEARRLGSVRAGLFAICSDLPDAAPEWEPERAAYDAWFAHIDNVLMQTVPTTAAGCVALARFVVDFCAEQGIPITQGTDAASVDNIGPLRLIAQSPALAGPAACADAHTDPVFAAIEVHAAALTAFRDAINPADAGWVRQHGGDASATAMAVADAARDKAEAAEEAAWDALSRVRPTTMPGLVSFARYISSDHVRGLADGREGLAFDAILSGLSGVLAGGNEREAVDWWDAPPGFMAYPAFEPTGFRRILDALPEEVARLHGAASGEFKRRMACMSADVPEDERQAFAAQLRADLLLGPLSAAAEPESEDRAIASALERGLKLEALSINDLGRAIIEMNRLATEAGDISSFYKLNKNPVGQFVEIVADGFRDLVWKGWEEMQKRVPSDPLEWEWRAKTIALPVLENGNADEMEAFALDLLREAARLKQPVSEVPARG